MAYIYDIHIFLFENILIKYYLHDANVSVTPQAFPSHRKRFRHAANVSVTAETFPSRRKRFRHAANIYAMYHNSRETLITNWYVNQMLMSIRDVTEGKQVN